MKRMMITAKTSEKYNKKNINTDICLEIEVEYD